MHDVGKIGVPDAILFKPGELDHHEFEQMKRHAPIGESIVSRIPGLESIARIAGEDHERWAGGGYPRGLKGEEIMPEACLLAIIDVFDAMTSDRPYRAALSEEEALLHLESVAGEQLDPVMTKPLHPARPRRPAERRAVLLLRHPLTSHVAEESVRGRSRRDQAKLQRIDAHDLARLWSLPPDEPGVTNS